MKGESSKMDSLQQSVQSVIDGGRIGGPVFLRCMFQLPTVEEDIVQASATLATIANGWMPSSPQQIYVQQSKDVTQVTTMIHYVGGQTAILSVNRVPSDQEASIDLVFVGSQGVIYHETPVGRHRLMKPLIQLQKSTDVVDLLNQAIRTGAPVILNSGG